MLRFFTGESSYSAAERAKAAEEDKRCPPFLQQQCEDDFKLGKWTAQTLISGADLLKIGYVSRCSVRDPYKHVILGDRDARARATVASDSPVDPRGAHPRDRVSRLRVEQQKEAERQKERSEEQRGRRRVANPSPRSLGAQPLWAPGGTAHPWPTGLRCIRSAV